MKSIKILASAFVGLVCLTVPNLNAQNVGIGTTTPGAKLMVVGENTSSTTPALNITDSAKTSLFHIKNDGKIGVGTTSPGAKLMVVGTSGAPTLNILHDGTTPMNPALRINDNGRVGLGTTSPGARLMVVGNDSTNASAALNIINSAGHLGLHVKNDARVGIGTTSPGAKLMVVGTTGAPTVNFLHDAMNPTNPALRINDNGRVGIGTTTPGARLMVVGSDTNSTSSALNITNSSLSSLFNIKNNGDIGVGTTAPTAKFQVGSMGDGTVALSNAWNTFSDRRYKENIRTVENALSLTKELHGVRFDWKSTNTPSIGFIAQEIEEVLPELVYTDEKGFKSVDYPKVVAVLVEAVKEQQKIIDGQEEINTTQASINNKLENQILELKKLVGALNPQATITSQVTK